ncbi:MAG TPA: heavy metal-binding domain-containing protein [Solirubrobacteraceae bacterium]
MAGEPVEDAAQEREQAESLARIEAGGIPLSAERRLRELRGAPGEEGGRGVSFTSDLSVNGFALCHQLGLTPLSQVMGSSIYQMGYQSAWGQMQGGYGGGAMIELDTLSQALNEVRERALHRLGEEARQIGADAVVGVETRAGESELGGGGGQLALEHMVLGTAVRRKDARGEQPVMTELSVADYALLLRAGIEPAGIVAWSSVFFSSYAYRGMLGAGGTMTSMQPYELTEFTQALYSARERTMGQINRQAAALGASGVVGVRIGHTIRPHTLSSGMGGGFGAGELRGMMVTFNAVGTAIRQHARAEIQAPKPVVDLFA